MSKDNSDFFKTKNSWSEIKDRLLGCYLTPYFQKLLQSNKPTFYVDCFAGKGMFDEFQTYGFRTFEMLINFNSFGFFRDACRVMSVDVSKDTVFTDLEDLVEYDATQVETGDSDSEKLLTNIAGGDYWKQIVRDYNDKRIDGYQAEKRLSTEYKERLKQKYSYVLDMPIRLKLGQRPKYRMIHVCDHENGCFLITKDEITKKVQSFLANICRDIHLTELLAKFCNEYGLICDFKTIYEILDELESTGEIEVIRDPATNSRGKSRFWEEKKGHTIVIRRLIK